MRFTRPCGAAAALLAAFLATAAWAQTSGGDATAPSGTEAADSATTSTQADAQQPAADASGEGATTADADADAEAPADPGYAIGDVVLGDPDAPVTVIEYASFTCPHCAHFATTTFPELKKNYIDTGKVKFILREVYFDQYGLWASMVARCGGEKGFYTLAHTFLATQESWTRADDIGHAIYQIGHRAGLSTSRLEQCLSDRGYAEELLAAYQKNSAADEVEATPTFIIDGEKHTGAMDFEQFSEILDKAS